MGKERKEEKTFKNIVSSRGRLTSLICCSYFVTLPGEGTQKQSFEHIAPFCPKNKGNLEK